MLPPMGASQCEAAARMLRQTETASLALMTGYRDELPGESLPCPACRATGGFDMRPAGDLACRDDGCGMIIGRWAMSASHLVPAGQPDRLPSRAQVEGTWIP